MPLYVPLVLTERSLLTPERSVETCAIKVSYCLFFLRRVDKRFKNCQPLTTLIRWARYANFLVNLRMYQVGQLVVSVPWILGYCKAVYTLVVLKLVTMKSTNLAFCLLVLLVNVRDVGSATCKNGKQTK